MRWMDGLGEREKSVECGRQAEPERPGTQKASSILENPLKSINFERRGQEAKYSPSRKHLSGRHSAGQMAIICRRGSFFPSRTAGDL